MSAFNARTAPCVKAGGDAWLAAGARATSPRMSMRPDLKEPLTLERIELNLFRGRAPSFAGNRLFGGLVIAQSLLAAYGTVEDKLCHSLHCYFIRAGDPKLPILYEVDRSRDGGAFATRRVAAIQNGQQIFNLAASFQVPEAGAEHQTPMPAFPRPDALPDEEEQRARLADVLPKTLQPFSMRPIELRGPDEEMHLLQEKGEPNMTSWFRAARPVEDDVRLHQAILAYASDMRLSGNAMRPHGYNWETPGLQFASLDHAMWFHHPTDLNRWHLYVMDSPVAAGGRGLNRGSIYDEDGRLVASTAQEGLMRVRAT
jgi:acyl-CoA thioesterase II